MPLDVGAFYLDVAEAFASCFNELCNLIFWIVQDEIVGGGVFEFKTAETALKLGNAVKTVIFFVFFDDSPEVIAENAALSCFFHGFKM